MTNWVTVRFVELLGDGGEDGVGIEVERGGRERLATRHITRWRRRLQLAIEIHVGEWPWRLVIGRHEQVHELGRGVDLEVLLGPPSSASTAAIAGEISATSGRSPAGCRRRRHRHTRRAPRAGGSGSSGRRTVRLPSRRGRSSDGAGSGRGRTCRPPDERRARAPRRRARRWRATSRPRRPRWRTPRRAGPRPPARTPSHG